MFTKVILEFAKKATIVYKTRKTSKRPGQSDVFGLNFFKMQTCILINVAITHSTCRTRIKDPQKSHKVTSLGPAQDTTRTRRRDSTTTHRGPADDTTDLPRTNKRPTEDPHHGCLLLSEVNNLKICWTVQISNCRHRPPHPLRRF